MNLITSITTCFQKYADFTGRASRSEYWWFFLFTLLVNLLANRLGHTIDFIAMLFFVLPSLAVLVRRLHDTNTSGWCALLLLIPFFGFLILLYFLIQDGTSGPNTYGQPTIAKLSP